MPDRNSQGTLAYLPTGDPPPRKSRWLKITAITAAVILLIYTGLSIFGSIAIMHIPRLTTVGSPSDVGLSYQDVSFPTRGDGLTLKGWYIPAGGRKVIIVVHGGYETRVDEVVDTLDLAHDLNQQGFDLLLFDLRGRGESEGTGHSLEHIDSDLGGALDYIESLGFSDSSIGMLGFCSGAASACIFASDNNLGAIMLDGCFASVTGMIKNQAARFHIPGLLVDVFIPGLRLGTYSFYRYSQLDPIDVVGQIQAPIFFVHEQHDDFITLAEMQSLLAASVNPSNTLWEIPGALHSEGFRTDPAEYIARVSAFFNSSLS